MNTTSPAVSHSRHPESPSQAITDHFATLGRGRAAFAYRLPAEREIHLGKGPLRPFAQPGRCFVIAPFDPEREPVAVEPAVEYSLHVSGFRDPLHCTAFDPFYEKPDPHYLAAVSELVDRLRERSRTAPAKTVYSRTIALKASLDVGSLFQSLCSHYPEFYTFAWRMEDGRIWIGSSPELLLDASPRQIRSMALAGTHAAGNPEPWDAKNIEEQRIVTREICRCFSEAGLTPQVDGPHVRNAGPVEHLCTDITAQPDEAVDFRRLARSLSPTPALLGSPKDSALRDLQELEGYERDLYGGYSGPVTNGRTGSFFVTLRCLSYTPERKEITLYVGGGITASSDPADEWTETCRKSLSLLNLLR